jgi:hypothetical protein
VTTGAAKFCNRCGSLVPPAPDRITAVATWSAGARSSRPSFAGCQRLRSLYIPVDTATRGRMISTVACAYFQRAFAFAVPIGGLCRVDRPGQWRVSVACTDPRHRISCKGGGPGQSLHKFGHSVVRTCHPQPCRASHSSDGPSARSHRLGRRRDHQRFLWNAACREPHRSSPDTTDIRFACCTRSIIDR